MGYYDLSKSERHKTLLKIEEDLLVALIGGKRKQVEKYFSDEDTDIRKVTYQIIGKIYLRKEALRQKILELLSNLFPSEDFKTRQTVSNAAGEIGKSEFETVINFFDLGLFDKHDSPRNAVIGSIKKMGEVNPGPVLLWARNYYTIPTKKSDGKSAMAST